MRLVIRELGLMYAIMITAILPSNATSKSYSNLGNKGYIEIQDNEKVCVGQDSNLFNKTQEKILKTHNIGYGKHRWLSAPSMCAKLTHKDLEDAYIYHYHDKNSPTHVFILYDRKTKKYLLAKVARVDHLQLISDGRISYMGNSKNISQMKLFLQTYINDQKYY